MQNYGTCYVARVLRVAGQGGGPRFVSGTATCREGCVRQESQKHEGCDNFSGEGSHYWP